MNRVIIIEAIPSSQNGHGLPAMVIIGAVSRSVPKFRPRIIPVSYKVRIMNMNYGVLRAFTVCYFCTVRILGKRFSITRNPTKQPTRMYNRQYPANQFCSPKTNRNSRIRKIMSMMVYGERVF
jgi:hypothetical protein